MENNMTEKLAQKVEEILHNYNNLKQEFNDFKEDKKRITLEQQIAELTEKLKEATKPKSFTQRLFNK